MMSLFLLCVSNNSVYILTYEGVNLPGKFIVFISVYSSADTPSMYSMCVLIVFCGLS